MSSALLFADDSVPLAEIRIDSLTGKKKDNLNYSASMAENEEREVYMRRDRRKRRMLRLVIY